MLEVLFVSCHFSWVIDGIYFCIFASVFILILISFELGLTDESSFLLSLH